MWSEWQALAFWFVLVGLIGGTLARRRYNADSRSLELFRARREWEREHRQQHRRWRARRRRGHR